MMRAMLYFVLASGALLGTDLNAIRDEPNLERRAKLALDYANQEYTAAREAYDAGDVEKAGAALAQMQAAVQEAQSALQETGRNPRKHAKPFKYAETVTRDLLRRLTGFENSMSFDDRRVIEGPKNKVEEIHDQWVQEIISGKQ